MIFGAPRETDFHDYRTFGCRGLGEGLQIILYSTGRAHGKQSLLPYNVLALA